MYSCGLTREHCATSWKNRRGVTFRDAHEIVGRLVLWCEQNGVGLDALPNRIHRHTSEVSFKVAPHRFDGVVPLRSSPELVLPQLLS